MVNPLEQDDIKFIGDLSHHAQSRVAKTGSHGKSWVWSEAANAPARTVARLTFATFRQLDILTGDINPRTLDNVLKEPAPASENEPFFIDLLSSQAQIMVARTTRLRTSLIHSKPSTAVTHEAGQLAFGVVRENSGHDLDVERLVFTDAFSAILENAGVLMGPFVKAQTEVEQSRPSGEAS